MPAPFFSLNRKVYQQSFLSIASLLQSENVQHATVLSVKTTGPLKQHYSGIIDVALMMIKNNGDACLLSHLVNPEADINLFISKQTGIYTRDVIDMPTWDEIIAGFGVNCLNGKLIGFGINHFDLPYIASQNGRYAINMPISTDSIDIKTVLSQHAPPPISLANCALNAGIMDCCTRRAADTALLVARLFDNHLSRHK